MRLDLRRGDEDCNPPAKLRSLTQPLPKGEETDGTDNLSNSASSRLSINSSRVRSCDLRLFNSARVATRRELIWLTARLEREYSPNRRDASSGRVSCSSISTSIVDASSA